MLGLKEAKLKIFKTDCKDYLLEGFSCSEPILTKDDKGLIDNYFIYASNDEETEITKPLLVFGVYSDLEQTAYANKVTEEDAPQKNNRVDGANNKLLYDQYVELYSKVRTFAFTNCTIDQKKELQDYLIALKTLSGTALWESYQTVAPAFFEWAKEQSEQ